MKTLIFTAITLLVSMAPVANAECFNIVNGPLTHVSDTQLFFPAIQVCTDHVTDLEGYSFSLVTFKSETNLIAHFRSSTETINACRGYCHTFALDGGVTNKDGLYLKRGDLKAEFTVIGDEGNLIIDGANYTILKK